jgi:hypothetical protein
MLVHFHAWRSALTDWTVSKTRQDFSVNPAAALSAVCVRAGLRRGEEAQNMAGHMGWEAETRDAVFWLRSRSTVKGSTIEKEKKSALEKGRHIFSKSKSTLLI